MKVAAAALALMVVAACGSTSTAAHVTPSGFASSPSPTATSPQALPSSSASSSPPTPAAAYAVLMKDFLEGGPNFTLSIVGIDGKLAASVTARKRSVLVQVGSISISNTTVYYLDGDSAVDFLRPDGTKGAVTTVPVQGRQAVAFAVSPDDKQIAVSVLDFSRYPVGTRLFVEDLHGGGHRVDLFTSSTVQEWPVGWHNGRLVIAVGLNARPQNAGEWFERAGNGFHVADPATGQRLLTLCPNGGSLEPEVAAGFVCASGRSDTVVSWAGAVRALPNLAVGQSAIACDAVGPLSPSGIVASDQTSGVGGGCGQGPIVYLVDASGSVGTSVIANNASPVGWIDANHLVVDFAAFDSTANPALGVIDVNTSEISPVEAGGFFAGSLPGSL